MESVLSYVFTLALSMIMAGGFGVFAERGVQAVQDSVMAQQAQTINNAAILYIQDNTAALIAQAPVGGAAVSITVPALACAGYLPASYEAGSGCPAPAYPTAFMGIKNSFGQNWLLQVTQPTAGKLQAIVMSINGNPYSLSMDHRMINAATQIGAMGGFVPYTGQAGDVTMSANNAQGVYNGWSIATLTGNGYINPGSGHLVSMLSFQNGQSSSSYLYRSAVAGQPQLNAMNTPLIMTATEVQGGACSPTGAIAQDGSGNILDCSSSGVWTATGGTWKSPVATYALLPATGNTVGDVRMVTGLGLAFTWSGTTWTALAVDQNGNLSVPGTITPGNAAGTANIGSTCSPNGAIAQNANGSGQTLSCQSGVWAAMIGSGGAIKQSQLQSIFAGMRTVNYYLYYYNNSNFEYIYYYITSSMELYYVDILSGNLPINVGICNISSGSCIAQGSLWYNYGVGNLRGGIFTLTTTGLNFYSQGSYTFSGSYYPSTNIAIPWQ